MFVLQSGLATVTCISWKGDFIVYGDSDGTLCMWDLRGKTSRYFSHSHHLFRGRGNTTSSPEFEEILNS